MPARKLVSEVQWEILLTYMEANPDFANSTSSLVTLCSYKKADRWVQLSNLLNGAEGCKKTLAQWREYWATAKYKARRKFRGNRKMKSYEGSGLPSKQFVITDRDTRIVTLTGEGKEDPDMFDNTTEIVPDSPEYSNDSFQSSYLSQEESQCDTSMTNTAGSSGTVSSNPEVVKHKGRTIKVERILSGPTARPSSSQDSIKRVKTDEQLYSSRKECKSNDDSHVSRAPTDCVEVKMEVAEWNEDQEQPGSPGHERVSSPTMAKLKPTKTVSKACSPPKELATEKRRPSGEAKPPSPTMNKILHRRIPSHHTRLLQLEERKVAVAERKVAITERKVAVSERTARALEGILEEISSIKSLLRVRLTDIR